MLNLFWDFFLLILLILRQMNTFNIFWYFYQISIGFFHSIYDGLYLPPENISVMIEDEVKSWVHIVCLKFPCLSIQQRNEKL